MAEIPRPTGPRRRWDKDGYLGDDSLLIVALADGTPAGIVVWTWIGGSGPRGCLELESRLFPEHRGRDTARLTLANRLEATTGIDNVAEQRALEKARFVREGVLRGRASCAAVGETP